ncbi:patatin-like phospholipase family protein [Burkholderia vietnamiensis]|nr:MULTISPECIES: patatin-like phospholipase family protein [Burkholderia]AWU99388.1 patatin-like phospholipase family protein [Burkholderia sp. JP2-270]MCA8269261.1 patatin-like phospholipase family protein [Burkholderia vietnamiensis]UKV77178.1 patatin-like phospholipase family protein [Burkholderia vietnamiensis]HDR8924576.1 patatin-like phospholipase family protein [Burkholderia vietnamiensis]HDR9214083.1 patatin-like phospholipase family protein [Burkholderia vietnamiensis]
MSAAIEIPESEKKYRPFLGVAISGGGSRAANFGMYVLKELERLGVLNRIDAISSVSGGSIVAAHFGLYYPKLRGDYWDFAEKDLRQDFRDDWLARHANPANWRTLSGKGFNASTILAKTYDDMLFHGAVFRQMSFPGPGSPHILINSTVVGGPELLSNCLAQGRNAFSQRLSTFVFSDDAFKFCLGSDLGTYSIAQAVAASSAYPLVFSPVVLTSYPRVMMGDKGNEPLQYLHVMDGGVSDNLGVDALVSAANGRWHHGLAEESLNTSLAVSSDKVPCFLIVVDAFIDDGEKLEEEYPDLRHSLLDRIIDPSWHYAFDALLQRRRSDSLLNLGIDLEARTPSGDYTRAVSSHAIPLRGERGMVQKRYGDLIVLEPNTGDLTCGVWHISLRDVFELGAGTPGFFSNFDNVMLRGTTYALITNTKTDLKFTGAESCRPEVYQRALADAAKILVREDAEGLSVLHKWMIDHSIDTNTSWAPDPPGTNGERFNVTAVKKGPSGKPSGLVRCLN